MLWRCEVKGVNFEGAQTIMGAPPGQEGRIYGLPVQRVNDAWVSVWKLSDEERAMIAAGGAVELQILSEVHPPVSLATVSGRILVEND